MLIMPIHAHALAGWLAYLTLSRTPLTRDVVVHVPTKKTRDLLFRFWGVVGWMSLISRTLVRSRIRLPSCMPGLHLHLHCYTTYDLQPYGSCS